MGPRDLTGLVTNNPPVVRAGRTAMQAQLTVTVANVTHRHQVVGPPGVADEVAECLSDVGLPTRTYEVVVTAEARVFVWKMENC